MLHCQSPVQQSDKAGQITMHLLPWYMKQKFIYQKKSEMITDENSV